jgi:hypothetical protein
LSTNKYDKRLLANEHSYVCGLKANSPLIPSLLESQNHDLSLPS